METFTNLRKKFCEYHPASLSLLLLFERSDGIQISVEVHKKVRKGERKASMTSKCRPWKDAKRRTAQSYVRLGTVVLNIFCSSGPLKFNSVFYVLRILEMSKITTNGPRYLQTFYLRIQD